MTLRVDIVTFDRADPMRAARFWADALDVELDRDPNAVERLRGLGATIAGRVDGWTREA
jgi:hypothetical protein